MLICQTDVLQIDRMLICQTDVLQIDAKTHWKVYELSFELKLGSM